MAKDIDLLTKNAKAYNEPGSQVYKVILLFTFWSIPHVRFNVLPQTGQSNFGWLSMFGVTLFYCLKDANTIKKVFIQRRTELEQAEPTKSSLRIRYLHHAGFLFWYIELPGSWARLIVPKKVYSPHSEVGILWFPLTVQKHVGRRIGDSKLPLVGGKIYIVCVCAQRLLVSHSGYIPILL